MDREPLEGVDLLLAPMPVPRLFPADVHVVAVEFAARADAALQRHLPATLGEVSVGRAAAFLAGRNCARAALAEVGGGDVTIGGRGAPQWPAAAVGSITHSTRGARGVAVAAAAARAARCGLGIDIEPIRGVEPAKRLARQVLHGAEADVIARLELDFATATTLVFSAKESVYKAIAPLVDRYFWFDAVALLRADAQRLRFRIVRDLGPGFAAGVEVESTYAISGGWVHTGVELLHEHLLTHQ